MILDPLKWMNLNRPLEYDYFRFVNNTSMERLKNTGYSLILIVSNDDEI